MKIKMFNEPPKPIHYFLATVLILIVNVSALFIINIKGANQQKDLDVIFKESRERQEKIFDESSERQEKMFAEASESQEKIFQQYRDRIRNEQYRARSW